MSSDADYPLVIHDGFGTAATAVQRFLGPQARPLSLCRPPRISITDFETCKTMHAAAGLGKYEDVGTSKAIIGAAAYRESGWLTDAYRTDVQSRPRSSYQNAITLAGTDSHACKCSSVQKSLEMNSPAIAIGLGPHEAVVEFFSPGAGGYCCCHRHDSEWNRRIPCEEIRASVSTTAQIWCVDPQPVLLAGELAANVVVEYLNTSRFAGGTGAHIVGDAVQWFDFTEDENCDEPHDVPYTPGGKNVVTLEASPAQVSLDELMNAAGGDACYADREVAWYWACKQCDRLDRHRVHMVFPPKPCDCGSSMQPGLERATGLTLTELYELHRDGPLTLAGMGLADESVVRCASTRTGEAIWINLKGTDG